MIREFSGVGKVEFLGCPSEVKKQRTCESLDSGAYSSNADDKAAGKRLV